MLQARMQEDLGNVLNSMIQYSNTHPSWEKSAVLLFLLGVFFGCTSIFNRSLFSMGINITESLFLLEVIIPCIIMFLLMGTGLDKRFGIPINLARFANGQTLVAVLPCAILFAVRNTIPTYAFAVSKTTNMRDFVFCTRLLQPIVIFVLEGCVTSRRVWRWHIVSLFFIITGLSLFLFHTSDPTVAGPSIPLLGAFSNPVSTIMNFATVLTGAAFAILFVRLSTAIEGERPWIPLQDLVAFHFIMSLVIQVGIAACFGTLPTEISTILSSPAEMQQALALSAMFNAIMIFLRMLCLAKTSCILTAIVPVYFVIPIRLVLGSMMSETSTLGVILSTLGMISFLFFTFTEFRGFGSASSMWVATIINLPPSGIAYRISRCIGAIYSVALFCALFPLVCKFAFGLATSYFVWSLILFAVPLSLLNHFGIYIHKSISAMYVCTGLLMFSFLPLQFGPIQGVSAAICFALEVVIIFVVGSGVDAIQMYNGYRPGYTPFVNGGGQMDDQKHDAELDEAMSQFVVGGEDEDE
jgi:hypothetical protein